MKDVIAIGSTVRDAFFETDFEIAKWPKSPSGKAIIIPFGEKFGAKNVHFTTGGNATNASVTFARQKIGTSIFTRIGKDVAGGEIRRTWKNEGVKYGLVTYSDLPTGYSVLLLQKGERSIITYHGAIDEFSLKGIDLRKLKSKWWYISLPGESYKALGPLLKYARENNIKVALNPSYIHLTGNGRKELLKQLKDITVLSVNRSEASSITGIPVNKEREIFKKLDKLVGGISVVTAGRKSVV